MINAYCIIHEGKVGYTVFSKSIDGRNGTTQMMMVMAKALMQCCQLFLTNVLAFWEEFERTILFTYKTMTFQFGFSNTFAAFKVGNTV